MRLFEATFDDINKWHHTCKKYDVNWNFLEDMQVGNIFVPSKFDYLFFKHGTPVAHDPSNTKGYAQPEGHHESIAQFPDRVYEGFAAWMCFGFYRIIDAGLAKRINVPSAGTLTLRCHVHGWSSTDDNPSTSNDAEGAFSQPNTAPNLTDGQRNHTFWVGVGDTPDDSVQSVGQHVYNAYDEIELVTHVEAGEHTVYVRGSALWPFKHNNFYFDSFTVDFEADTPEPEPCKGLPREQYERTYLLMHPGADKAWVRAVLDSGAWDNLRVTIGGSADDGGIGALDKKRVLAVRPADWNDSLSAFYAQFYPGVDLIPIEVDTPDELRRWLEDWMSDTNPTLPPDGGSPSRLAPGLHLNTGDSGATDYYKRLAVDPGDLVPPSVKAYGRSEVMTTLSLFKAIDPRILTVGRIESYNGVSLEGVDLSGDLLQRAQDYMAVAMRAWEPHRDYVDVWELTNEQDPVGIDGHRRFAQFHMHCMDIANANGYTLALFSYSTGVPEWEEMVAIADTGCLAQAKREGHYLALHEYDWPLDAHYGQPIPDAPPNPERGAIALRYRYFQDAVGGPENMPGVLLTEVNVAKDLRTLTASEWDAQIRWYMTEVSKDEYVKAVHLFGWGSLGGAWEEYDIITAGFEEVWYQIVLDYSEDTAPQPDLKIIPYSQRDPRWSSDAMGNTTYTVGGSGCAMTGACMIATQVEPTLDPGELNAWLSANHGYTDDALLIWNKVAERVEGLSFKVYLLNPTHAQITAALENGPVIVQVNFHPGGPTHFVVALYEQDDDVRMIDPWTGEEGWLLDTYGDATHTIENSILRMAIYTIDTPSPPTPTLIGFNDYPGETGTGAAWMADNGIPGLVTRPIFIGTTPQTLDFSVPESAGVKTIVNLRYSYSTDASGGNGTLPKPGTPAWDAFIDAAASTINTSTGVWGWEICNEVNNPREWPLHTVILPQDFITLYNAIYDRVDDTNLNLAPGALDPFNAGAGDPRAWIIDIFNGIRDAQFVTMHGYLRGPDPTLVNSTAKFTDEPLLWQYLNYPRCVTALHSFIPSPYNERDIYITEFNHLWRTSEAAGDYGWVDDERAGTVIDAAFSEALRLGFKGLSLYRWSGDAWCVENNPYVKDAVRRNAPLK